MLHQIGTYLTIEKMVAVVQLHNHVGFRYKPIKMTMLNTSANGMERDSVATNTNNKMHIF